MTVAPGHNVGADDTEGHPEAVGDRYNSGNVLA